MGYLDLELTRGKYWGGAQIPFWLLMILTILPITGILGLDHLVMRSPWTAILKALSFIPLLGFWYFFDIAQVTGEREFTEKFGFALPFLGPAGIGEGMFTSPGVTPANPDKPTPWLYAAYFIATLMFFAFPVNKLIIGDYWGALFQGLWFFMFPLTIFALAWGLYDVYRALFDVRGVFEKGSARVFPWSWIMNPHYNRAALGPLPPLADEDLGIWRLIKKYFFTTREMTDASLSLASMKSRAEKSVADFVPAIVGSVRDSTASIAPAVSAAVAKGSMELSQQVPEFTAKAGDLGIELGKTATIAARDLPKTVKELAPVLLEESKPLIKSSIQTAMDTAKPALKAVDPAVKATSAAVEAGAGAAEKIANSVGEGAKELAGAAKDGAAFIKDMPKLGEKVASEIGDPKMLLEKAKASEALPQSGGSLMGFLNALPDVPRQKAILIRNATDKVHDALVDINQQIPDLLSTTITDTGDILVTGIDSVVDNVTDVLKAINQKGGGKSKVQNAAVALSAAAGLVKATEPAVSSTVLIFSVALIAAGGYAYYIVRKGLKAKKDLRADDSPPDANTVRGIAKA
jgi:hypothetical protein